MTRKITSQFLLLAATASLICLASPLSAEVTFFIQREGSPADDGRQLFIATAPDYAEQDFEDPALAPDGSSMPVVQVGEFEFGLTSGYANGTPLVPIIGYSPEFTAPGKIYSIALVAGSFLTLTPTAGLPIGAVGAWIFDDGGALDSVYLVTVWEADGSVSQAVLANEIRLDCHNHEIEGFIGAVSSVGITSVTIMAVNPETLELHLDSLEIDHLMVAPLATPTGGDPAPPDDGNDPSDESGNDADDVVEDEDSNADGDDADGIVEEEDPAEDDGVVPGGCHHRKNHAHKHHRRHCPVSPRFSPKSARAQHEKGRNNRNTPRKNGRRR